MGGTVLFAIGSGVSEAIQPAVIADIFFLHNRGTWDAVYWATYLGAVILGSIIAGPTTYQHGWRSFWWVMVALSALSVVLVIVGFPETKWHRLHPDEVKAAESRNASRANSQGTALSVSDEEKEDPEKG